MGSALSSLTFFKVSLPSAKVTSSNRSRPTPCHAAA